jgi:hypothetical protein
MASIIRIKRSGVTGNPNTLGTGELAYSNADHTSVQGGGRLYIGMGAETNGNALEHVVIGGKYFTDMLDHSAGTLTAGSAIIVDSNKKIDDLLVDNLQLNGNTLGTTNANGNLVLDPNGTGLVSIANAYTLPRIDGTNGYVLTTNGTGTVSWAAASSALNIAGDTGTESIALLTETLTITGGDGITTTVGTNSVTIDADSTIARRADTHHIGTTEVALNRASANLALTGISSVQFPGSTSGNITVQATAIAGTNTVTLPALTGTVALTNQKLNVFAATSSSELAEVISDETGTGALVFANTPTLVTPELGAATATSITGNTAGITIAAATGNNNVTLVPTGTGTVDVSSKRITSVAEPTQATDAATKGYVDATKAGLDIKESVRLATIAALTATYDNGTSGVGATLTNSGTQAALQIDGVNAANGNRILVKNQTSAEQNGIYVVTDAGSISSNWVLTRATDFDTNTEVTPGAFTFVEEGNTIADNGYVLSTNGSITMGTTELVFTQFSGAGQIIAGDALTKDGNRLDVVVAASGGIEIVSDALQLKSGLAGDGLTYAAGVLTVGGTADRITVSADAIDIASTYAGQNTITTLGTVTTGTWNATTIGTGYGGTGLTAYTAGDLIYASANNTLSTLAASTEGKVLQINSSGMPVYGDVDGGTY